MKKAIVLTTCLISFTTCISAQETQAAKPHDITIKFSKTPQGLDNYYSGIYYFCDKEIYNMRNYLMYTGNSIKTLKINPAGSSYAFLDNKKGKNTIGIYSLINKDYPLGKITTNKLFKPLAICYAPDAKSLYVLASDGKVHIYDTRKTRELKTIDANKVATRLDASPNGYYLIASSKNALQVINLENQTTRTNIKLNADFKDLAFSPNNKMLAVLTADGACDIYDTKTFTISNHYDAMGIAEKCYFHPENKYLAVVTGDQRIAFINLLNEADRQYLDAKEAGVKYLNFSKNVKNDIYLLYNTNKGIVYTPVGFLSPNRQEKLKDELNSRMDEWMKRMEGESLDDYNARVNEQSRLNQMRLFETQIATNMADNLLTTSEVKLGNYNADMNMLTLDFNNMPSIYLTVPASELESFMEAGNLEFSNTKYGLNDKDEFEVVYTEVTNKKTGQKYVFDNTERKSLAFLESEDNFVPFEQLQGAKMEELKLEEIKNNILKEAQDKNIISDHTKIDVHTKVVNSTDASGKNIFNYEVAVSYSVDEEFSAKDDFAPGRFKCEESNAAQAMLAIVKKAMEEDFAKYIVEGKQVKIEVTGMADALPFSRTVAYDGCYGDYEEEPVYKNGELSNITVTRKTGISQNEQLAYLRAMGVKDYMEKNISSLQKMKTSYDTHIEVSENKGGEYRRIGVKFTFVDAL